MADIHWDWGDNGYTMVVTTRTNEVRFVSDMPTVSMDVQIRRGLPEAPVGPLDTAAAPVTAAARAMLSPHDRAALDEGIRYTYDRTQVKVHVFFQDEGTVRIHLNMNSKGEITTLRPPGVVGAHHSNCAKGLGKGVAPV